jgi:hypothetical protein
MMQIGQDLRMKQGELDQVAVIRQIYSSSHIVLEERHSGTVFHLRKDPFSTVWREVHNRDEWKLEQMN